jgi:hypothetical protein
VNDLTVFRQLVDLEDQEVERRVSNQGGICDDEEEQKHRDSSPVSHNNEE